MEMPFIVTAIVDRVEMKIFQSVQVLESPSTGDIVNDEVVNLSHVPIGLNTVVEENMNAVGPATNPSWSSTLMILLFHRVMLELVGEAVGITEGIGEGAREGLKVLRAGVGRELGCIVGLDDGCIVG